MLNEKVNLTLHDPRTHPDSCAMSKTLFQINDGLTIIYDTIGSGRKQLFGYNGTLISSSPLWCARIIRLLRCYGSRDKVPYFNLDHSLSCGWHSDWHSCSCKAFEIKGDPITSSPEIHKPDSLDDGKWLS